MADGESKTSSVSSHPLVHLLERHLEHQGVPWDHGLPELAGVDPTEEEVLLGVIRVHHRDPSNLGQGFHDQNPRHDGPCGKVAGKEIVVYGHVLQTDFCVRIREEGVEDSQTAAIRAERLCEGKGLLKESACGRVHDSALTSLLSLLVLHDPVHQEEGVPVRKMRGVSAGAIWRPAVLVH